MEADVLSVYTHEEVGRREEFVASVTKKFLSTHVVAFG